MLGATLLTGCLQPVTEHRKDTRADLFLGDAEFLGWMTLAQGFLVGFAETFLEFLCNLKLLLTNPPSFPLSSTRVRTISQSIGSPSLLCLLSIFPHRLFPPPMKLWHVSSCHGICFSEDLNQHTLQLCQLTL